jgi:hypothetical protein
MFIRHVEQALHMPAVGPDITNGKGEETDRRRGRFYRTLRDATALSPRALDRVFDPCHESGRESITNYYEIKNVT